MTPVAVTCALCGLDTGARPVQSSGRVFCCPGCANVHAILSESGIIGSGEDFRSTDLYRQSLELGLIARPDAGAARSVPEGAETREAVFQVSGMWCTSCGWLIEHALAKLRGVTAAEVMFTSDLLKVRYCPQYLPAERIAERVNSLGYRAEEYRGEKDAGGAAHDLILRTGLAAFLWLNVMTFSLVVYAGYFDKVTEAFARYVPYLLMGLATPAVFWCAWPVLRAALLGARHGMLRMESLLALGILTAYGYSVAQTLTGGQHVYFDTACAIVTLVLAGKLIERGAKDATTRAVTLLYRLMPRKARVMQDGREHFVTVEALAPGTQFLVKDGERIPADGVVAAGHSYADESVLTGESAPREKRVGDAVVCGSLNAGGALEVRATRTSSESTLAQMIRMVEQALAARSRIERQVDRAARVFTPAVIAIAVATFVGWLAAGAPAATALMRAIAVLVIACPCALGIATPLAVTAAVGRASRRGILVGDSRVLETVQKVDVLVLDKTGTVTEGDFRLLEAAGDTSRMAALASLEMYSEHPLGRALARACVTRVPVEDAQIHEGLGITGTVAGERVFVGSRRLAGDVSAFDGKARTWESEGRTVAFFGWDGSTRGVLAFGDSLKPDAAPLCAALRERGIETILVSGDAEATTRHVAASIGAARYVAEALPARKVEIVRELQQQGKVVAMLGDGVNDAPSLAQADLGMALGSGTDVAMQAAPLVLMTPSLGAVEEVFDLARRTLRVVRQNLFWAFGYNALGITLAVTGVLNPILAAGAMVLSSLSVILNSRRLQ